METNSNCPSSSLLWCFLRIGLHKFSRPADHIHFFFFLMPFHISLLMTEIKISIQITSFSKRHKTFKSLSKDLPFIMNENSTWFNNEPKTLLLFLKSLLHSLVFSSVDDRFLQGEFWFLYWFPINSVLWFIFINNTVVL